MTTIPTIPMRTRRGWQTGGGLTSASGSSQSLLCWNDAEKVPGTSAEAVRDWLYNNKAEPFLSNNLSPPPYTPDHPPYPLPCPIGLSAPAAGTPCNTALYPITKAEGPQCAGNGAIDMSEHVPDPYAIIYDNLPTRTLSPATYNSQYGSCLCSPFQFNPTSTIWPNAFVTWASPSLVVAGSSGFSVQFTPKTNSVIKSFYEGPWCDAFGSRDCTKLSTPCDSTKTKAAGAAASPTDVDVALFDDPPPFADKCDAPGYKSSKYVVLRPPYVPSDTEQDNWPNVFTKDSGCVVDALCDALRTSGMPPSLLGIAGTIQFKLTGQQVEDISVGPLITTSWTYGLGCHAKSRIQAAARPYTASFVDDVLMPLGTAALKPETLPSWRAQTLQVDATDAMTNMLQVQPPIWVSRRALLKAGPQNLPEGPINASDVASLVTKVSFQLTDDAGAWGASVWPSRKNSVEPVLRYGVSDAGQIWGQVRGRVGDASGGVRPPYIGVLPAGTLKSGGVGPTRVVVPNTNSVWDNQTEAETRPVLFTSATYLEDPRFAADPGMAHPTWTQAAQRLSRVAIQTVPGQARTFTADEIAADPWASAYNADTANHPLLPAGSGAGAVDKATQLVMSPHFTYLLGDLTYATSTGVMNDSFIGGDFYRVHDDILAAPDKMANFNVRTVTFLLDGGQLIACCLGKKTPTATAESDADAQMVKLRKVLNQGPSGTDTTIGTRWPIPLDPKTSAADPRSLATVPTLPSPGDGGLARAEEVLLNSFENLYDQMAGDWLANTKSLFYTKDKSDKFALRIYWLNLAVDALGYRLDVFGASSTVEGSLAGAGNESFPSRGPGDVQSATPIVAEMLAHPQTWDAPKDGLTCTIKAKTVPCTWVVNPGRDGRVFQSPLGNKLIKFARGEEGYALYGSAPATYTMSAPTETHDQIWLTQNVYSADPLLYTHYQDLFDPNAGIANSRQLCTATTGNAAPAYSKQEQKDGFIAGKPPQLRYGSGICACLNPGTASTLGTLGQLDYNSAAWDWFKSQKGVISSGSSLTDQIIAGLAPYSKQQSAAPCIIGQCGNWLAQYAPPETGGQWFEGKKKDSAIADAGGTYDTFVDQCQLASIDVSVCTNNFELTADFGTDKNGVNQGLSPTGATKVTINQSCSQGGGSGNTYQCVNNVCTVGAGTNTLPECMATGCAPPGGGSTLSTAAVIGIIVGSILGTALIIGVTVGVVMHKRNKKAAAAQAARPVQRPVPKPVQRPVAPTIPPTP
jgi:hypothetical protein